MVVVDASCLFEALSGGERAEAVRERLLDDSDQIAPHIIDVEVFSAVRRDRLLGVMDGTAADQAIDELAEWGGERFSHRLLLRRAWELRATVRGWDAMYVALAEAFECRLVTLDAPLAQAPGPECVIDLIA